MEGFIVLRKALISAAVLLLLSAAVIVGVYFKNNEQYAGEIAVIEDFELKPGKYLLHRTWGYDETDYIEIFDDGTVQFAGEYWSEKDSVTRQEEYHEGVTVLYTERQKYSEIPISRAVAFVESYERAMELGIFASFTYVDENTFEISRKRLEEDDVVNYLPYDKEYDPNIVISRYTC